MESDNETVAEIVKCIRHVAHNVATANKETKERWRPAAFLATVADRVEAAHKREVAELRECLKEAKVSERGRCRSCWSCDLCGKDCKVNRWRKALKD